MPTADGVSAAVVVLAAIGALVLGPSAGDQGSFEAGYRAVSNPTEVRAALSDGRISSTAFCDAVLDRAIAGGSLNGLRHKDFLRGCRHAVGDAME